MQISGEVSAFLINEVVSTIKLLSVSVALAGNTPCEKITLKITQELYREKIKSNGQASPAPVLKKDIDC